MGLRGFFFAAIYFCVTVSSHNETLDKGIVYLQQGNFVIAANHWTIVADVQFEEITTALDTLMQNINYLHGIISDPSGPREKPLEIDYGSIRKELVYLRSSTNRMRKLLADMKGLITLSRAKRGLIDLGGETFKYLFGTATSKDVENLNKRVNQVKESNKKIFHILDEQLTVLNSSVLEIRKNRKMINELLQERKQWLEMGSELKRQFIISAAVRHVGHIFSELQTKLVNLRESIDVISQWKINSFLMPQSKLARTLFMINKHLPTGVSLFVPPVEENMFKFYLGMSVIPVAMPHKLRLFIRVPLISSHSFFDMYRAVPLPVGVENMQTFIFYQPRRPYFAISQDRQSFFDMDEQDSNSCVNSFLKICSPRVAIYKLPLITCEYALFVGDVIGIANLCEKRLIRNPKPLFYRADNEGSWIYSVPETLTLTVVCPSISNQESKSLEPIKVRNTGLLRLPDSCAGYAQGVLLPPHFMGHTVLPMTQFPSIVVPPVKEILNETEFNLLRNFSQLESDIQVKFMPEEQSDILQGAGISMRNLRNQLDQLEREENFRIYDYSSPLSNPTTFSVLLIMGILTCLTLSCCTLFRARKKFRCCNHAQTKQEPDDPERGSSDDPATTADKRTPIDDIIQRRSDESESPDSSTIPGISFQ